MRLQAGLRAWTQVLRGQMEDKADVDMDTEAPQAGHKPGGEPRIKVWLYGWISICLYRFVPVLNYQFSIENADFPL